jgi:hypothetical protein
METVDYSKASLYELACYIRKDWKNPFFGAVPYLQALASGLAIHESYGMDSMNSIVRYFLSNASTWRGPVAKAIKLELNARSKR